MSDPKILPISEASADISALVGGALTDEPVFIATDAGIRAVLLGIDAYDALMERLEDLEDNLSILEARIANEPARPLNEFLHEQREMRAADVSG